MYIIDIFFFHLCNRGVYARSFIPLRPSVSRNVFAGLFLLLKWHVRAHICYWLRIYIWMRKGKQNKTKRNDRQTINAILFFRNFVCFFFRLQFVRFDLFAFALARWLLSRWWMPNVFGPCVFKCKRETYHHHLHIIPFDIWLKIVYVHEKCDQRNERK